MNIYKILKLAQELKPYREKKDPEKVENLVKKALKHHQKEDVDVSFHGQHYGWFVWNPLKQEHEQKDLNDFKQDDQIKDVRKFVHNLKKVKLEDYGG